MFKEHWFTVSCWLELSQLPLKHYFFYEKLGSQSFFFYFEIIINVLVSSFQFIWIPMLWVYCHYKYFYSYSAGIDFIRLNLTSVDVRFWRVKSVPDLQQYLLVYTVTKSLTSTLSRIGSTDIDTQWQWQLRQHRHADTVTKSLMSTLAGGVSNRPFVATVDKFANSRIAHKLL